LKLHAITKYQIKTQTLLRAQEDVVPFKCCRCIHLWGSWV